VISSFRIAVSYRFWQSEIAPQRIRQYEHAIGLKLDEHEIGKLRTTIEGIRSPTAPPIAQLGDPARFRNAAH
jgi:hypothetical protein